MLFKKTSQLSECKFFSKQNNEWDTSKQLFARWLQSYIQGKKN